MYTDNISNGTVYWLIGFQMVSIMFSIKNFRNDSIFANTDIHRPKHTQFNRHLQNSIKSNSDFSCELF